MGTDKALLKIDNQTMIERIAGVMSKVFKNILISTNYFESYRFLGLQMVEDVHRNHGPISGVHAALVASTTNKNFILSCDLPLISEEMIRYIIEYNSSKQISIPIVKESIEPLCGVYRNSLIPVIEEMMIDSTRLKKENGRSSASMKQLIEKVGAEFIETKSLPFFKDDLFFNMNSMNDYEFIKKKFAE